MTFKKSSGAFLCSQLIILLLAFTLFAQPKGTITGTVVDAETGEPLPNVNIVLEGTMWGAATDLDGHYRIDHVPVGTYNLVSMMIGYSKKRIENVQVNPKQVTRVNFTMGFEVLEGKEVIVTAKALKNTEAILLKDRQKAQALSDAISAEAISRSGSGNAAEAMKQVTGASVVGGKYVYVRGLGDRYTSTQLNGAELPSTNPYKRAGSIDLIPSNLVDNIVTAKSFTPDKPGNFSGGTVDIKTKDFPDEFTLNLSASTSYNNQVTFNDDGPILYSGSDTDWLGSDDGFRDIPGTMQNEDEVIPDIGAAGSNIETALKLDRIVKSFNPDMVPVNRTPGLNQSYSISAGNQVRVLGRPLGFLASLTYSNGYSSYDDGDLNRWNLGAQVSETLGNDFTLTDTKSSQEVLWGGLLKASYKFTPSHVISLNGLYNQNGESSARYLEGKYPYDLDPSATFRTSVLSYLERTLTSVQLSGDHHFESLLGSRISWKASVGGSKQDEPDNRYFTSFKTKKGLYGIKPNVPPSRYYRFMDENRNEFSLDITVPFKLGAAKQGNVKFGGLMAQKHRDYYERLFEYHQNPVYNYDGDINTLFGPDNIGLIDTTKKVVGDTTYKRYDFGIVMNEIFLPANRYEGDQDISAAYAMVDFPILDKLRFIGGARFETTDMRVVTEDKKLDEGHLKTEDVLPSANLIYSLTPNANIRAAYGKTLARPLFREIAPYASFDFMGGDTYIGNNELERTLIDNFDLRWEWFPRPGEIYAVSAYYKDFRNPIEVVIKNVNHEIEWKNVDEARVMGMEFEVRKRLDGISPLLHHVMAGGNLSLVNSRVDITEQEMKLIRATRPEADDTRPFQGQSPYIVNVNVTYDHFERGIVTSLYYNVFGERLSVVSLGGTPDVYEQPAGMLNWSFSWNFTKNLALKLSAKNLLDNEMKMTQEYKGEEYIYSAYKIGRSFSIGLKYKI